MKQQIIILIVLIGFWSCSSPQKVEVNKPTNESKVEQPKKEEDIEEEVEVRRPFSGPKYQNDSEYFRAVESGESENLTFSSEKALLITKRKISANIQSLIKSVSDRYAQERQVSDRNQFKEKVENLTREVVEQKLSHINVIGEKTYKNKKTKIYKTWVAIEIPKQELKKEIANKMEDKFTADEKKEMDYDKEKFEETFDKELEKQKN
ncbi:MAG: hypothetical protein KDK90_05350 [Leptospiraceae bacterium]|nr:hypothetical protein [Leptospiraceae bacterium]